MAIKDWWVHQYTEVDTNDTIFARGYHLGYVNSKIEDHISFTTSIPSSVLSQVKEALSTAICKVEIGEMTVNNFSAEFFPIKVEF